MSTCKLKQVKIVLHGTSMKTYSASFLFISHNFPKSYTVNPNVAMAISSTIPTPTCAILLL